LQKRPLVDEKTTKRSIVPFAILTTAWVTKNKGSTILKKVKVTVMKIKKENFSCFFSKIIKNSKKNADL
jgi:hypothetical protein